MPNIDPIPNPFGPRQPSATFALSDLVGLRLVNREGGTIDTCHVVADVIGLYFSAHWCPPCRMFTPHLTMVYDQAKSGDRSFEVVFVTSDRSRKEFEEYFKSMGDWLAIPFDSEVKMSLKSRFSVTGIPTLVLIDGLTGQVMTREGRQRVSNPDFLRSLPPDLDKDVRDKDSIESYLAGLDEPNEMPCSQKIHGLQALIRTLTNALEQPAKRQYYVVKKDEDFEKTLQHRNFQLILKFCGFRETRSAFACRSRSRQRIQDVLPLLSGVLESLQG